MQACTDDMKGLDLRLSKVEQQLLSLQAAFLLNDLGIADLDGHRRAHADSVARNKTMEDYKKEATKNIITGILGVLLAAIGTGLIHMITSRL